MPNSERWAQIPEYAARAFPTYAGQIDSSSEWRLSARESGRCGKCGVAKKEFRRSIVVKSDYVSIEKRDGVAIVRFDRNANLNAFDEKLVGRTYCGSAQFFR